MASFWGFLAFVLLHGGPLWAGARLGRRLLPRAAAGPHRACVALLCWASWLVLSFRLLATLRVLTLGHMLALTLPIWALACLWRQGPPQRPLAARRTRPLSPAVRALMVVVLVVMVIVLARAVAMPPLGWDSLTYHLTRAGYWVQTGSLDPTPIQASMADYTRFPENGEILAACFLLPFHGDTLVNLLNFPFLFLAAVALAALGREFGLRRPDRALLAGSVCLSPMMLAYVTTAYVDIQVAAETLCGVLFLVRAVRSRAPADLGLVFVAFGLALGTKLNTLPVTVPALALAAAVALRPARGHGRAAPLGAVVLGGAVFLALAAPSFVRNALETGNPFYPFGIVIPGVVELPDSPWILRYLAQVDLGDWRKDVANAIAILGYACPDGLVRTAGPKFLLLLLAAIPFLARLRRRRDRLANLVLALAWLVPLVSFYGTTAPGLVAARRFWMVDTARFLAAPLGFMALCALLAVRHAPPWARYLRLALVAFLAADLWLANHRLLDPLAQALLAMALLAAAAAPFLLRRADRYPRARAGRAALAVLLVALWCVPLQRYRDLTRYRFFESHQDLQAAPIAPLARGWQRCDQPERPMTIAFLNAEQIPAHNWFWYPLLGRRLQNRALHVPAGPGGFDAWLAHLEREKVDRLFVQLMPPFPEAQWIVEHPDRFVFEDVGTLYAIYRFEARGAPAPEGR